MILDSIRGGYRKNINSRDYECPLDLMNNTPLNMALHAAKNPYDYRSSSIQFYCEVQFGICTRSESLNTINYTKIRGGFLHPSQSALLIQRWR